MAEAGGKALRCSHCGHDRFRAAAADVGVIVGTLASGGTNIYACARCGHLEWFVRSVGEAFIVERKAEPLPEREQAIECVACHATMPAEATKCPSCGWSYVSGGD
jgi:ribosomal protein L40E